MDSLWKLPEITAKKQKKKKRRKIKSRKRQPKKEEEEKDQITISIVYGCEHIEHYPRKKLIDDLFDFEKPWF